MQSKTILAVAAFMALHTLTRAQDKSSEKDVLTIYKGSHSYKEVSVAGKTTEVYVDDRRVAGIEAAHYDSLIQVMRTDVDEDNRDYARRDGEDQRDEEQADRDREQASRDREQADRNREQADRDREQASRDQEHAQRDRERAQEQRERAQEKAERDRERAQEKRERDQEKVERDRERAQAERERAHGI
jgi:hypothetical protein